MSNEVLQLSPIQLKEVFTHYANNRIERNAPGVVFAAKLPDTSITAYKSGKVLFQGSGSTREAMRWGTLEEKAGKKVSSAKGDTLPEGFALKSVIGSDETGTGDFFGPMTVAACYVPADKIELIHFLGVKDSKMLTDDLMRKIAPDLKNTLTHSILILGNEKYNTVQAKGWSQGKIKALLHNQALKHVLSKIAPEKPEFILIDQFAERGIYYNHVKAEKEIIRENVLFSTKAEQLHVSVAAASILARVAFLEEMDKLSLKAGVTIPKGASSKVDEVAARIYLSNGEEFLSSITKKHFANTGKAMAIANKKRRQ
ncbi:ribonuclease HIII [Paenisporosarcina sp. HGH0030]|uniref:ribonuclease HIII n=1 Tax=Paenisporosarcina sp. HGH0030 TaxID=1078085 RepID=UPI00034EC1E7|nr:ribonuclease HIII [Paenisporosarcina sp. HGH0030]EPD54227.1 ribonuclease HIII [Paenisporosarcina sp. HGH0030]